MKDRFYSLLILGFGLLIIAYAVTSMWSGKNPFLSWPLAILTVAFGILLTTISVVGLFRREPE